MDTPGYAEADIRLPRSDTWERTGNTKTDVVVGFIGGVPVAVGRANVPRFVVPGAAAQHSTDLRMALDPV